MFFERYNKNVMEPFAISVISGSFNSKYAEYTQPTNTDNFDYLSPDGMHALEVVSVIPKNELEAYEYEKQLSKGKTNLKKSRIKCAKFKEDGHLLSYYGGSLRPIIKSIEDAVKLKSSKAKKRTAIRQYDSIDLCVCVQDSGLMDLYSYQIADFTFDFGTSGFNNIVCITPSYFFRYTKGCGFEEYARKKFQ